MLKVINLFAGPGAGKSTTAAGLYNLLKLKGVSVELVTEYAKDLTYSEDFGTLTNQLHVVAEQDRRLRRLVGKTEWAVTDSPLPLSVAYMTSEYEGWLPQAIKGAYDRYDNFDFLVKRVKPYSTQGRTQTESEALALDIHVRGIFNDYTGGLDDDPDYQTWEVTGDSQAPYFIARKLGLVGGGR